MSRILLSPGSIERHPAPVTALMNNAGNAQVVTHGKPGAVGNMDAVEKLDWQSMRWKMETFHKILKSGCKAEQARLRTAERLVRLIAVFCILAWRVFRMTMINRTEPGASPELAPNDIERKLPDHLIADKRAGPAEPGTLSSYLIKMARLGGYLARTRDPPPGNIVMWRGVSRLTDIRLGAQLNG